MEKDIIILGKFYLKNGNVIEEKVTIDKTVNAEEVISLIEESRKWIEQGFSENIDFNFSFGKLTLRGSELAAVQFSEQPEE